MVEQTSDTVASKAGKVLHDPNASADAKSLAGSALTQARDKDLGVSKPFSQTEAEATEGIDSETGLFEGVHPETNERVSVTLAGLQTQFGKELGEKKYLAIAGIAGGSVFFNPTFEATSFRPPLGISSLKEEHAAMVEDILNAKE